MYVCVQNEIQRTWAYLETLCIGSEEVRKELPVDADRFVGINIDVKRVLKDILTVKNAVLACSKDPELIKTLEITKAKLVVSAGNHRERVWFGRECCVIKTNSRDKIWDNKKALLLLYLTLCVYIYIYIDYIRYEDIKIYTPA